MSRTQQPNSREQAEGRFVNSLAQRRVRRKAAMAAGAVPNTVEPTCFFRLVGFPSLSASWIGDICQGCQALDRTSPWFSNTKPCVWRLLAQVVLSCRMRIERRQRLAAYAFFVMPWLRSLSWRLAKCRPAFCLFSSRFAAPSRLRAGLPSAGQGPCCLAASFSLPRGWCRWEGRG